MGMSRASRRSRPLRHVATELRDGRADSTPSLRRRSPRPDGPGSRVLVRHPRVPLAPPFAFAPDSMGRDAAASQRSPANGHRRCE
jgi:hypothetical protein